MKVGRQRTPRAARPRSRRGNSAAPPGCGKGAPSAAEGGSSKSRRVLLDARKRQFLRAALADSLGEADALLIVPPFAGLRHPALGLHLLQACCREAGLRVQILYANFLLAAVLGEEVYGRIGDAPTGSLAGERFFARAAFGGPPLGRRAGRMFDPPWKIPGEADVDLGPPTPRNDTLALDELRQQEPWAGELARAVAAAAAARGYPVVGCTTVFEQTAASVAILRRVKRHNAAIITVLGGANCEGEMGRGLARLGAGIDYVFSGESEVAFPAFLGPALAGTLPAERIIPGQLCRDLDRLPLPDFAEFFQQRRRFLPDSLVPERETVLLYETSRGCWWGEKHHCTFCGLNGEGMAFRQKSPERVLEDLRRLGAYPTRQVSMTDNIMPHRYFQTLLPRLAREAPRLSIFYEQKANLSLGQMVALAQAGVRAIQPGIEALSTSLLERMRKGVSARQNLALLRYARATGIAIAWNLLWGFPGDEAQAYQETLALVPLLHHLPPPEALWHISIDRFSPYFDEPERWGVKNLRPIPDYADFLPKQADVARIAYHFTGEYACGSHRRVDVIERLLAAVARWRGSWSEGKQPGEELRIAEADGAYVLVDTRQVARIHSPRNLTREEAALLLAPHPRPSTPAASQAVEDRLAVMLDGWFVPLAVATPDLIADLAAPMAPQHVAHAWVRPQPALNVLP